MAALATTLGEGADADLWHQFPPVVPSTGDIILTAYDKEGQLHLDLLRRDTGVRSRLVADAAAAILLASGDLAFTKDGALLVARFDADARTVGPATPFSEPILRDRFGIVQGAVSPAGTLAFVAADPSAAVPVLGWISRTGSFTEIGPLPPGVDSMAPPDGTQAVAGAFGTGRVFVIDLMRGVTSPLRVGRPVEEMTWHPDGRRITLDESGAPAAPQPLISTDWRPQLVLTLCGRQPLPRDPAAAGDAAGAMPRPLLADLPVRHRREPGAPGRHRESGDDARCPIDSKLGGSGCGLHLQSRCQQPRSALDSAKNTLRSPRARDEVPTSMKTRPARRSPDAALQESIHDIWDQLAAFAAADYDAALVHLLSQVASMIDAQNAYWMGAVRLSEDEGDPLLGWRPRRIRYLQPLPNDERFTEQRLREINRGVIDELSMAHARLAGTFRSCRMRDLVSARWFKSDTYKGYLARGVRDSLVVAVPVSPMAEGYYGFLRMRDDHPFTATQRDVAFYVMRGLTWFHRQVLLGHGLIIAASPLSPTERRVLALLLTDRSEKLIAADLCVSPATLHTYVRDVLRKFDVSGRNGLTALWLGRQG